MEPIRRVEFSVNGIRTDAHNIHNWNRRRAHERNREPGILSLAFQHETGTLRSLREQAQHVDALAEQISDMVKKFHPEELSLAGHSFGTTLILEALREHPELHATSIHLVASAADSDCGRNGLNLIVERGQVERVYLYCCPRDWALFAAQVSQFAFGWRGRPRFFTVRHGDLGKLGGRSASPGLEARLRFPSAIMVRPDLGHTGWFIPEEWGTTMLLLDR
jgi:pimeloyl-ACP methyl ester carboxylesterase